jgi:cobalamin biosynthesis protein CobD/CbiB
MLALTLGQAKAIGVLVVIALIALAIGSAWLMKTIMQKVALVVILGLLAILVWTQRSSLDDCADRVRAAGLRGDTTCSFFGRDVQISTNRDS